MPVRPPVALGRIFKQAQIDTFNCNVTLYRTSGRDEYGAPTDGVTGTYPIRAGLDFTFGQITERDGTVKLVEYDVVMRVSRDQTVLQDDIVRIDDLAGITGSFGNYSVYGNPDNFNSSVRKVYLRKVS